MLAKDTTVNNKTLTSLVIPEIEVTRLMIMSAYMADQSLHSVQ